MTPASRWPRRRASCGLATGSTPGDELGPVVSAPRASGSSTAIASGIAEGAEAGARRPRMRSVPERPKGYFVGPTLLDDVQPGDERLPGGDLRPGRVDDAGRKPGRGDRADQRGRYGNAASIFTESGAAARKFRYEVETGNIGINVGVAAPMAYFPFSGAKRSFFGTLHPQGRDAVRFFTESKVVITRWTTGDRGPVSGVGR